jgi:hypothetical protein
MGKEGVYYLWEEVIHTSAKEPLRVTRAERINLSRIDDRILGSVIYLYRTAKEAEDGHELGGTGFLVSVPSETDPEYLYVYAVTNKHVVHEHGYAPVVRTTGAARHENCIDNPDEAMLGLIGNREIIELASNQWTAHSSGDDIAIALLGTERRVPEIGEGYTMRFHYTIPDHLLIDRKVIRAFDVGPGDDVYMCGRFTGHAGKFFNEPSARWGTISLLHSRIELEEGNEQEVFLVEMRSLSGFSGSPVVWSFPLNLEFYLTAMSEMRNEPPPYPFGTRRVRRKESGPLRLGPWLVGIDCGSFPHYYPVFEVREENGEVVERKKTKNPKLQAKSHAGVAAVVPAWKLRELLHKDEEIVMARKREDEKLGQKKSTGKFDRDVAAREEDDPLTSASFDDALRRASRKTTDLSEPESEKTRTSE